MMSGSVIAVCKSGQHTMSKATQAQIQLLKGLGVEGDAHLGKTVKHRSRVAKDPTKLNLRQVHLIHEELHDELRQQGFDIVPGYMGENITTRGIALLDLPRGTQMRLGEKALIEVTGLRNPCAQLDGLQNGLMKAVLDRDEKGRLIRKAGIMAIVLESGPVKAGDPIQISYPPPPHEALDRV